MKLFTKEKIPAKHLLKHETKKQALLKFSLLLLVFLAYGGFISWKYGMAQGFWVSILTWSFFVLSTPVADAGFLISFPVRLIIQMRMLVSQIIVWFVAVFLNIYTFFLVPDIYNKTDLLKLFYHIIAKPIPFWLIFLISAIGTIVSIQFGDELMDTEFHKDRVFYQKHRKKNKFLIMIFLFIIAFILYNFLLKQLGIHILS